MAEGAAAAQSDFEQLPYPSLAQHYAPPPLSRRWQQCTT